MGYYVGVDTGGTFTDVVAVSSEGRVWFDKAFSTPARPEDGVLAALENLAERVGLGVESLLAATDRFAHGTTVSTNALLQRSGARTGLLTTRGFEHTLLIGRGPVGRVGGLPYLEARDFLQTEEPPPLVERRLTRGLAERVAVDGRVLVRLAPDEVAEAVRALVAAGVEALAVCLLWSFRNPAHELLVRRVAAQVAPELPVSLSCEVAPQIGEFERVMTTVVNAYVAPVTERYIAALQERLRTRGLACPVQVMKCSGGLVLAEHLGGQSVAVINSGPVGGLVGARQLGRSLSEDNLLTTDMGGTSFDVGLVARGDFEREDQPFLSQGVPVQVPAVKVVSIGAGGGSIAWTEGRRLRVGPRSAGAVPGPACYGLGGTEPTVTDALVVLGLLDPEHFFGGRRRLDSDRALESVRARVAEPLGLDVVEAAAGIYEIVTARMSDLIRKVTIESGYDPRHFVLVSYGGAGPAHCALLGRDLGVRDVVVPPTSSVFSALGIAFSDVLFSYARSEPLLLGEAPHAAETAARVFSDLSARARADLVASGIDPAAARFTHKADLRYAGQMNELSIAWPAAPEGQALPDGGVAELRRRFEDLYESRFGRGTTRREAALEAITFRLEACRPAQPPEPPALPEEPGEARARAARRIYLRPHGWLQAAVHDFAALRPGATLSGPSLIERNDTTVFVPPGMSARVDRYRNVRIEVARR